MEVNTHINFEISVSKPIFDNVSFLSLSKEFYGNDTKYNFKMPFFDRFVNRFICNGILNSVAYRIYIKTDFKISGKVFFSYMFNKNMHNY